MEVLGYPDLPQGTLTLLEAFFGSADVIAINDNIVERAIDLRRLKRMKLGDSLIAATALEHDLSLATNNTKDYKWIDGLVLINPI